MMIGPFRISGVICSAGETQRYTGDCYSGVHGDGNESHSDGKSSGEGSGTWFAEAPSIRGDERGTDEAKKQESADDLRLAAGKFLRYFLP
jgi:hypothetical protein